MGGITRQLETLMAQNGEGAHFEILEEEGNGQLPFASNEPCYHVAAFGGASGGGVIAAGLGRVYACLKDGLVPARGFNAAPRSRVADRPNNNVPRSREHAAL
jgi:hypothetical protein